VPSQAVPSQAVPSPAALSPAESQAVFRAVLDALARPGTLHRLPARNGVPAALLPLLALSDLSTSVCVLVGPVAGDEAAGEGAAGDEAAGDEAAGKETVAGDGWPGVVRTLTSAPMTALREARLITALRPVTGGELAQVRTGSAAAPEEGALVTLAVDHVSPKAPTHVLAGPGISGRTELRIAGLPDDFIRTRRQLTQAFPAGADFLLVAPDGTLAGLPRTTRIEAAERAGVGKEAVV
jgi:alpha-D-ribose 1-methylphosphonate 5-triphosphate synthase subunit PhnH